MLENSFIHLPGIGPETEERLWAQGYKTWNDLSTHLPKLFGGQRVGKISAALNESRAAFDSLSFDYFQGRLKGSEMWRLLPIFIKHGLKEKIAYLDIETTGLGFPPESHTTTISVLFQGRLYMEHEPHKKYDLMKTVEEDAKLLVTFNGGTFDLPFLRREFGLSLRQAHLDLRFWFAKLNHRGGLKKIQSNFLDVRQRDSMDIDGYDAVKLWRLHQQGVPLALETLLTYNAEDTIVLEQLAICGLNIEAKRRPHLEMPTYIMPVAPVIPTSVCPKVYQLLRRN